MSFFFALSNFYIKSLILNYISGSGASRIAAMPIFDQSMLTHRGLVEWACPNDHVPSKAVFTSPIFKYRLNKQENYVLSPMLRKNVRHHYSSTGQKRIQVFEVNIIITLNCVKCFLIIQILELTSLNCLVSQFTNLKKFIQIILC